VFRTELSERSDRSRFPVRQIMKQRRSSVQRVAAEWLEDYIRQQTLLSVVGAIAALMAGVVVLVVTYFVLQGLLYFLTVSFGMSLQTAGVVVPATTWIILALLFVAYRFADWGHLEDLQFESRGRLLTARVAAYGLGSPFLSLAAGPKTAHSFVKVISAIALAGPGLLATSRQLVRRVLQLRQSDREAMARLIAVSLKSGAKVELAEAADRNPESDWERVVRDLSLIDGIVILRGPPAAVTLTDGFRERIAEWRQRNAADAD
jgi:hypothetical protein